MSEAVNHPQYYKEKGIEVIDVIDAFGLNFSLGSAIKYICRAGKKDPSKLVEDLEKANFYIRHEIERLKKEK